MFLIVELVVMLRKTIVYSFLIIYAAHNIHTKRYFNMKLIPF